MLNFSYTQNLLLDACDGIVIGISSDHIPKTTVFWLCWVVFGVNQTQFTLPGSGQVRLLWDLGYARINPISK